MKAKSFTQALAAMALTSALALGASSTAQAGEADIFWSVTMSSPGVRVGVANGPVVIREQVHTPVHVHPRHVYVPPRVVYVPPPRVVYGYPGHPGRHYGHYQGRGHDRHDRHDGRRHGGNRDDRGHDRGGDRHDGGRSHGQGGAERAAGAVLSRR